jgi:hypothetical protein
VIDESDVQYEKQFDPRISTFLGMKIDWSDENENAEDSIRVKCEFDSKTIILTCQWSFTITIESGIQNRSIAKGENAVSETILIEPSFTIIRRS